MAALRQPGSIEEVAGARADVEVAVPDVLAIPIDEQARPASPHEPRGEPEDERVVHPEDRRRVVALAAIGGIIAVHLRRTLDGRHRIADAHDHVHRLVDGHPSTALEGRFEAPPAP